MTNTITYQACPVCDSTKIAFSLRCKDFTVSNELFEIWQCDNCSLRFTQQIPVADEIGRYYKSDTYISHSDTSEGLINKLYKLVRRYTLGRKRLYVQHNTGKFRGNLLDVGCGTGAFLHEMKKTGWKVMGLEPDADARAKAKELYDIDTSASDKLFQLANGSFDGITMWHVLEHVHELHTYMDQLKKLLTSTGKLFIAVPNYTAVDAGHYKEYWAAYDVPRHLYHFSPKSIRMLAERHGFRLVKSKPMWADTFYIAMLSEQYKTGSIQYVSALWQGFLSTWHTIWHRSRCSSLIYVLEPVAA